MRNSQKMPKPNLQQTPNPKCLETITDQTNNNNKPCNPNQRTQLNPAPTNISFSKPRFNQTQSNSPTIIDQSRRESPNPSKPSRTQHPPSLSLNPPTITDQSQRESLDPSKPSRTQHPSSLSLNPDPKRKSKER